MAYEINLKDFQRKEYRPLGSNFYGEDGTGNTISFTNYYMEMNQKPFFGISGEFHFSRCNEVRWEDEIIKMKMCGINIIATYVFWIHHEEEEGIFDFSGSKNLRKFVELCKKHKMYVILRIGPFDHGEVRNGGFPDWLYGKSFEVRKLNEGFLYYTKRLYSNISRQIEGLLYKDNGPIIATQIDNEYMHSSAAWEITTGISNEWVFGGDERERYMLTLRDLAKECGIITPFYTCTGWGGAITPDEMMPLWGGYAYRPWLFYARKGEHPVTEEYVYQDFHNNNAEVTSDFKPVYLPEDRPYACCEMGGGMTCTYNYRFILPYKSVDAMANIKMASGCNFLGYYVFQGGSNPKGKHGTFMNEAQVPKISYDYQAALGEFGQIRESYQRLKSLHYFARTFGEALCNMQTVLPDGASHIAPDDLDTLRYALRTDGKSGFLFLNNFQDHIKTKPKNNECITLHLKEEDIQFSDLSLNPDENCILPFHMDIGGIDLVKATAQAVTRLSLNDRNIFVFLKPDGMNSVFYFEDDAVTEQNGNIYRCDSNRTAELFRVTKEDIRIEILCLSRALANQMYIMSDGSLLFADGSVMEDETGIRLETVSSHNKILTFPCGYCSSLINAVLDKRSEDFIFDCWTVKKVEKNITVHVKQTAFSKYEVSIPENFMDGLKDARIQIDYTGDIGHAFIDGDMISDNFCNYDTWEIGLKTFRDKLVNSPLTISITPLRKGVNVNVESAMAARMENADSYIAELKNVRICPVYEFKLK